MVVMLVLLVTIIVMQNAIPIAITKVLGASQLIGMAAGSISMAGGHGTAGGFSTVLEQLGLPGASTVSMAAATFGLIAGSMIGGPVAERLIRRHLTSEHMEPKDYQVDPALAGFESEEATPAGHAKHLSDNEQEFHQYATATYTLLIVMAVGTLASRLLGRTGITFPTYFGSLIMAAIVRNIAEATSLSNRLELDKIVSVGNISLSVFLGMAMVSLKLWELQSLALPLLSILFVQVLFMLLCTYFVAFRVRGSN